LSKPLVLVIDDSPEDVELVSRLVRSDYDVDSASSGIMGLERLSKRVPEVVLLDLRFPDGESGLDTLRRIKEQEPSLPVIMVTESVDHTDTVECVKAGAFHYLVKPPRRVELLSLMSKAIAEKRATHAVSSARDEARRGLPEIVGESRCIKEMLRQIEEVAPTTSSVLIVGESGTGKELVARWIHEKSPRSAMPLVVVPCPAIVGTLLENEFFGVAREAAYTGAVPKEGRFERANGGTIFLDEVGDIDLSLQPKLLRVLQEGTFERVGGAATIQVDVRVISATNRSVDEMADEGSFRMDLLYRLNTYSIRVPPLRERLDDVPHLATHFAAVYAARDRRDVPGFDDEAMEKLCGYSWSRNNVRELANCIEAAMIRCRENTLTASDLWLPEDRGPAVALPDGGYREAMLASQRRYAESLLTRARGNIAEAAHLANLSSRGLYDLLKRTGLDPEDFR
jgi:DNA-binding NtrC family response regulator